MRYEGITVETYLEAEESISVTGREFSKCFFDNCRLKAPVDISKRPYIGQMKLEKCTQRACAIYGAVLDEISVRDMGRTGRLFVHLDGSVFRHVTLQGRITAIKNNYYPHYIETADLEASWKQANIQFYNGVDWALDISSAEFTSEPEFFAIPGHLIRRDPQTQVLVKRSSLEQIDLSSLPRFQHDFHLQLSWYLSDFWYDSIVLAAAKKAPYFKEHLQALKMLREAGIAEKD